MMQTRELRARLLADGNRLELEAAAARNAGDDAEANRLAGRRDARYHLADAIEQGPPAEVLAELPNLVELARAQADRAEAQASKMRARSYAHSAQVWGSVATYWRALADAYGEAAELLQGEPSGVMHPTDTGPGWVDSEGRPARMVRCPDCGQLEWWTEQECQDHGKCRAKGGPCWCELEEGSDG